MRRFLFSMGAVALTLTGCVNRPDIVDNARQIDTLAHMLCSRIPDAKPDECQAFARDAIAFANRIEHDFDRTTSPYVHNTLVNLGIKQKGLCWHYADALYLHLRHRYPHLQPHLVGAHIGSYWREHNAVAVTGVDNNFSRAIILDAWRSPGRLVFLPIASDSYRWRHRKARELR